MVGSDSCGFASELTVQTGYAVGKIQRTLRGLRDPLMEAVFTCADYLLYTIAVPYWMIIITFLMDFVFCLLRLRGSRHRRQSIVLVLIPLESSSVRSSGLLCMRSMMLSCTIMFLMNQPTFITMDAVVVQHPLLWHSAYARQILRL